MTHIPESLRRLVMTRAGYQCEYYWFRPEDRFYTHEIDHIIAEQHGGVTEAHNLCLACAECNVYKGSNLCSLDGETGSIVALFHPRQQRWSDHFQVEDGRIRPLTAQGRVTVRLLRMNAPDNVERRRALIMLGQYFVND